MPASCPCRRCVCTAPAPPGGGVCEDCSADCHGRLRCRICERPAVATALCGTHYQRQRRGRPLDSPIGGQPRVRLWVRAELPLLDRLRARASADEITVAEAIRRAIEEWAS